MSKSIPEVKVGDWIYFERYGDVNREQVIKVTKNFIRTKHYNMRHPDGNGRLRITGNYVWSIISTRLETAELKQRWREANLKNWIKNNWDKISFEDIEMLKSKAEK